MEQGVAKTKVEARARAAGDTTARTRQNIQKKFIIHGKKTEIQFFIWI